MKKAGNSLKKGSIFRYVRLFYPSGANFVTFKAAVLVFI
jgi:hypothetical protein